MRPQYSILTQPTVEPVTIDEMMTHSRVDSADDMELLAGLIPVAREYVDGVTGRVSYAHEWLLSASSWAALFGSDKMQIAAIHRAPLVSVESISYYPAGSETLTTIDPASYRTITTYEPGLVQFLGTLPEVEDRPDAIQITFTAGHSEPAPAIHRHAIKMLAAHLYDQRVPVAFANPHEMPFGLRTMIESQKIAGWCA
jgi:uncharacterized phiE125 gp8 family phage protein